MTATMTRPELHIFFHVATSSQRLSKRILQERERKNHVLVYDTGEPDMVQDIVDDTALPNHDTIVHVPWEWEREMPTLVAARCIVHRR